MNELMDLDTLFQVRKAAPQLTVVPFDLACWVVRAMEQIGRARAARLDRNRQRYWESTVKEITAGITQAEGVTFSDVGRALRDLGLTTWRQADGSHVAWSQNQLDILKKHFRA
jgi:hypothetical protein